METLSRTAVRRLAILRQRLAGPRAAADRDAIHRLVLEIGCLQLDPTSAVARNELLVVWSRLGAYERAELDALLWEERRLFEYWAHAASIVATDDLPIHEATLMRVFARRGREARAAEWMRTNGRLRRHILRELERRGPLRSRDFDAGAAVTWESTGWTADRNVPRMLDFLWAQGRIAVSRRVGQERYWDLRERVLPPADPLPRREAVRRAALRAVRMLGAATEKQVRAHFIRGRYEGLPAVVRSLVRSGELIEIGVEGVPGRWYAHPDDLDVARTLEGGDWDPRTALLSPFDNLICDRERTLLLWDFDFRLEIYTPAAKRQYGFFVMPVLAGDRLIGRIDPRYERKERRLVVNAVHREPGVSSREIDGALAAPLAELAAFLGAEAVDVR